MKQCNVRFEPEGKTVTVHSGDTILEAAGLAGIIINTPCGGKGTCGKCGVVLKPAGERVYACQYKVEDDLVVEVPKESRFFQQKILEHGIENQIQVSPSIAKVYIGQFPGTAGELAAGLDKVSTESLEADAGRIEKRLVELRAEFAGKGVTVVLHKAFNGNGCAEDNDEYRVLCVEGGDTRDGLYGVAVDVGTTTVVAKLIDMRDGTSRATAAMSNPQIKFGDDVVARISHASEQGGYAELHDTIIAGLNELIAQLCKEVVVEAGNIYELTAAGNTTMSHLLLGFPVEQLGQAPYHAYSTKAEDRNAGEMGIAINPCGNVHVIENIAGFVGSDTTAVAVAVDIEKVDKTTLIVDIGTNGELILKAGGKMYSASCAAGPALEGARISQGSRAVEGAIEKVRVDGDDIVIDTIGGGQAGSICGSGLIDLMAVLVELGIVEASGRMVTAEEMQGKLGEKILARLCEVNGEPAFLVAGEAGGGQAVYFTQKDVRETQLSKAAIRAGIKLLQAEAGIGDDELDQVLLAGAFGNYIRRSSACRIGLLPDIEHERIVYIGNAASSGAQMVLLSSACRRMACRVVSGIEYIEIAHKPDFQMVFAECLMF